MKGKKRSSAKATSKSSESSGTSSTKKKKSKTRPSSLSPLYMVIIAVSIAVLSGVIGYFISKYFSSSLVDPIGLPPVIDRYITGSSHYQERLWGSYRSNVYFGMRPRLPRSVMFGFAWVYATGTPSGGVELHVRHSCEHGDNLARYGWSKHDGRSFGIQDLIDSSYRISTKFLVNSDPRVGHSWTASIKAESRTARDTPLSLLFYMYNEGDNDLTYTLGPRGGVESISGHAHEIGHFKLDFSTISKGAEYGHLATDLNKLSLFSEFVKSVMTDTRQMKLSGERYMFGSKRTRLIIHQVIGSLPLEVEVRYSSGPQEALQGAEFESELTDKIEDFDDKFESIFKLKQKGYDDDYVEFGMSAFSNLIGSLSYFYGRSKVKSPDMKTPVDYFSAPLFTGVPSRSFFPRGFLWDEGFHQLIVTQWDINLSKEVIGHWMDLLNTNGWLPREQILGEESRSKVPEEFVVQLSTNGNPPTFFLTIDKLLDVMETKGEMDVPFLKRLLPRLKAWFNWFHFTQRGPRPSTYQWKGRNSTMSIELNPKTLSSGLDDYPRPSHPSPHEYHVDLRCWLLVGSRVLVRIADIVGADNVIERSIMKELSHFDHLNKLHWNDRMMMYSDYGNHTYNVKLVINRDYNPPVKMRKVINEPSLKFVDSFGYVNLFPFLVKLLPPDSVQLESVLNQISNESLLWTNYGLRSLARNDPFYNKANTGQDKPYWRGAIWININYMCLGALRYYGNEDGPHQARSKELYEQLRNNIIINMYEEYQRTGYIWEQYDDRNGRGKGTHPFTGWSSLVLLMMAEIY